MIGRTNASSGGGGSKLIVTVDAGAVVTCTDGNVVKTAVSNGTVVFTGITIGSWTITAELDGKTASEVVVVKHPSVTLLFNLVLYDNGRQYESVTGGWDKTAATGELILDATTMRYKGGSSGSYAATANALDVSDYNTLHAILRTTSTSAYSILGIGKSKGKLDKRVDTQSNSFVELTIDLSGLSGLQYVMFGNTISYNAYTEVQKIWIE